MTGGERLSVTDSEKTSTAEQETDVNGDNLNRGREAGKHYLD